MRKTRVISLALVVMLFFSMTAFTQAPKPTTSGIVSGANVLLAAKKSCNHNYITTQYGEWKYSRTLSYGGLNAVWTYEYVREVTEVCTKCSHVKTHKEYKYVNTWLGIVI